MSDAMLHGVLNMPVELWRDSEIDMAQRHSRYIQASERIRELEAELEVVRNIDRQTVLDCILSTSGMSVGALADAIVQMIRGAEVEALDKGRE